ncbi:tRNA wybutosine-synthesizing protein 5-like [Saccoglossus kowalevskii]
MDIKTNMLCVRLLLLYATVISTIYCDGQLGSGMKFLTVMLAMAGRETLGVFSPNLFVGSKPLLFKGATMLSRAFTKWTDDYFWNLEESDNYQVGVERGKKENRSDLATTMSLKQFLKQYTSSDLYLVDPVPEFLRKDVQMPVPLQCKELADTLLEAFMWFSSGGTKSVLHFDTVDNINCVFSGTKEFLLIDPNEYSNKIEIDHPEGNYCGVDVDRVNYTTYPGLAEVKYHHVIVEAGDCLYMPFKWFHQVNSYGRNIAVNVWWNHYASIRMNLSCCGDPSSDAIRKTLDDFYFHGIQQLTNDLDIIKGMVTDLAQYRGVNTKEDFVNVYSKQFSEFLPLVKKMVNKIFKELDTNSDGILKMPELLVLSNERWKEAHKVFLEFEDIFYTLELQGELDDDQYEEWLYEDLYEKDVNILKDEL